MEERSKGGGREGGKRGRGKSYGKLGITTGLPQKSQGLE